VGISTSAIFISESELAGGLPLSAMVATSDIERAVVDDEEMHLHAGGANALTFDPERRKAAEIGNRRIVLFFWWRVN
jgi:hypothetical protein